MNWFTRGSAAVAGFLWGIGAWVVFVLACLFSLLVALLVPGKSRRQRLGSAAARCCFVVTGVPVELRGIDNLPTDKSVVVANHASYVDGILLKAYLPPQFSFVIKGEMRNIPVVHFLLRRFGSRFVERNETLRQPLAMRGRSSKRPVDGESLGFFPEGTFRLEAGLGRFRPGAFVAAVKGQMPVVPIAIHGTRAMMPSGSMLPRRTRLVIEVLPVITPGDPAFVDSKALGETARRRILAALGEPDLLAVAQS